MLASGRRRSKLRSLGCEELALEVGDAAVGRGEFTGTIEDVTLKDGEAMGGVSQRADLLAEFMDLAGPARLVMFFPVFGEASAFQRGGQFSVQVGVARG
jgi:hypothetical protein